jgi:hypothetical protein
MKHMRLVTFCIFALCVFCLPVMAQRQWVYEGSNSEGRMSIAITERQYGSRLSYQVSGDYKTASSCTISGSYFPAGRRLRAVCKGNGRKTEEITGSLSVMGQFNLNTNVGGIDLERVGTGDQLPTGGLTGAFKIVQTAANGAKYTGQLEIKQVGSRLSGRAVWDNHKSGTIDGTVQDETVRFTITYSGGLVGTYNSALNVYRDSMEGGTASSNKGGDTVKWYATRLDTGR